LRKNNRKIQKAKTQKGSYQVDRNQMPTKNRKTKGLPLTEVVDGGWIEHKKGQNLNNVITIILWEEDKTKDSDNNEEMNRNMIRI